MRFIFQLYLIYHADNLQREKLNIAECFCELHHPISAASDFYLRPRCALDLIRRCSVWSVDVHVMGPICQSLLFVLWEPWLFFSLQTIPFRFPLSARVCSTQGFKNRTGTAGFQIFFPFPVRSGTVNRVWFFIFYVSKSKNTKIIFLCYCSGFKQ